MLLQRLIMAISFLQWYIIGYTYHFLRPSPWSGSESKSSLPADDCQLLTGLYSATIYNLFGTIRLMSQSVWLVGWFFFWRVYIHLKVDILWYWNSFITRVILKPFQAQMILLWHRILGPQLWIWEGAQSFAEENLTSPHRHLLGLSGEASGHWEGYI